MSELLARIDDWSDRLSPIVVKEIRQMVRGREFNYSFGISLLAGLVVAFFGLADAVMSSGTSGSGVFSALMGCLALLGLVAVPIGTFMALRSERVEQTLDLITQTSLTPRRIVVGKLMTQCIKLIVLFAGLAPFIAMSFLLGGVDLTTILVSLALLFLWSVWVCAMCLFMSAASHSRGMAIVLFVVLGVGTIYVLGTLSTMVFALIGLIPVPPPSLSNLAWFLGASTVICLVTMANLLLLAENRLSLPIEDRSTALRVGFFVQFLVILTWAVAPLLTAPPGAPAYSVMTVYGMYGAANVARNFGLFGGIHLAVTAMFTVTEDMVVSRRVFQRIRKSLNYPWSVFRPGGGRGALWILMQMLIFLVVGRAVFDEASLSWFLGICGYILFFSGVPTLIMRRVLKARARIPYLRVGILLFFPILSVSADLLQYFLTPNTVFDGTFSLYHVLSPIRALVNWNQVVSQGWIWAPIIMGLLGLLAYLGLFHMGRREDNNAAARYS